MKVVPSQRISGHSFITSAKKPEILTATSLPTHNHPIWFEPLPCNTIHLHNCPLLPPSPTLKKKIFFPKTLTMRSKPLLKHTIFTNFCVYLTRKRTHITNDFFMKCKLTLCVFIIFKTVLMSRNVF